MFNTNFYTTFKRCYLSEINSESLNLLGYNLQIQSGFTTLIQLCFYLHLC